MKIYITSVFVDDQAAAKAFYTEKLGFEVKHDIPMGEFSWLTLVSPEDKDGTELLLEPSAHKAVPPYKAALKADGIPAASFQVSDIEAEVARLKALDVVFTSDIIETPPAKMISLDDTCGNYIQLIEML